MQCILNSVGFYFTVMVITFCFKSFTFTFVETAKNRSTNFIQTVYQERTFSAFGIVYYPLLFIRLGLSLLSYECDQVYN